MSLNLNLKIWLALGLAILLMQGIFSVLDYRQIEANSRNEMRQQAVNLRAVLMATRRVYHQQFLASGLPVDERTLGFLPAHAMSRISVEFKNWTHSAVRFNNVSDRPRNPANLADASELAAIAWHRAHPREAERIAEISDTGGAAYFHFTAPIWTEAYCLTCHAAPEAAPSSIRERYAGAYGYRVGDLRGIVSIKLPIAEQHAAALSRWWSNFWQQMALLLTSMALLGLLLNRLVIRRVDRLAAAVQALAGGDYSQRIAPAGTDELDRLGQGFDRMAEAVEKRDLALAESEVQARTLTELAPVGIFRTDAQGYCTYVNDIWQALSGMSEAEAHGLGWAGALHPADRERVAAAWNDSLATGQPFRQEYRFQRPDGSIHWVLGQTRAEYDPQQRLIGYIGSITDLTERKRTEELEHYGAFQAGIAEMATTVLHNIGNAITAVTHDADALARASQELDRVAELLAGNARQTGEQLQIG